MLMNQKMNTMIYSKHLMKNQLELIQVKEKEEERKMMVKIQLEERNK